MRTLNVIAYEPDGELEGQDFFSLATDGNGNYKVLDVVSLSKVHIDSIKLTTTGESLNFSDSFVTVTKEDYVLNVDTSAYKSIPQYDLQNNNRVLSLSDAGKHIYCYDCTITVPYHADVPFPIGTRITIVTQGDGITIDKSGGSTVVYAGGSDSGSHTVASRSVAHLLKTDLETWYLYGENINI